MPFTTTGVLLTFQFLNHTGEARAADNACPKMQRDPRATRTRVSLASTVTWAKAPGSVALLFGNREILPTTAEGAER